MLENAKWVTGGDDAAKSGHFLLLRRSFFLKEMPKEAYLFCRALPLGEFRVNGKVPEEDLPFFPLEDPESTLSVKMVDISGMLTQGENAVSVILPPGGAAICEVGGNTLSGEYFSCPTDSSWCVAEETAVTCKPGGCLLYGEESAAPGFDLPLFDDAAWENARIIPGPGGILTENLSLPLTKERLAVPPKEIFPGEYDFFCHLTGQASFTVQAARGDMVLIRYAHKLGKDGKPLYLPEEDSFLCTKGGKHTFCARYSLRHFRYASLSFIRSGQRSPAVGATACAFSVHTDLSSAGSFTCSDTLFSELHESVRRMTRFSFQSLPTFSPEKGENGRTAIGFALCGETLYNFEIQSMYRKWLLDLIAAQKRDGQIPMLVPPPCKNGASGSAADGAALILLPYEYYLFTGESELLSLCWLPMKRYMSFLASQEEEGILHLSDRDIARKKAGSCPTELPGTALYYRFAAVMATCAPLLGESSAQYEKTAARVRAAFRDRFLENGRLIIPSQTAIACTLAFHLEEEEEKEGLLTALLDVIEKGGRRFDVGMLGLNFLITALGEAGKADLLCEMIRNEAQNGTLSGRSFPFPAFGDLDRFFYRYLAGIRPAPKSLIISPCLPEGMDYIRAAYRGITVEIDRTRKHIISDRPFLFLNGKEEYRLPAGDYNFPTV